MSPEPATRAEAIPSRFRTLIASSEAYPLAIPPTSSFIPGRVSWTVRAAGSSRIASEPTRARALASSSGSGSFFSRRARRQSRTTGAIVTSKAPPDRS